VATVNVPGVCSARVDLLQPPPADEVAAADDVPVAAAAELVPAELLELELELELPHAAMSPAARTGSRTAGIRRAESKAHNLHRGGGFLPRSLHGTPRA